MFVIVLGAQELEMKKSRHGNTSQTCPASRYKLNATSELLLSNRYAPAGYGGIRGQRSSGGKSLKQNENNSLLRWDVDHLGFNIERGGKGKI